MRTARFVLPVAAVVTLSHCATATCPKFVRYQQTKIEVKVDGQTLAIDRSAQKPAVAYIETQDLAQYNVCRTMRTMQDGPRKEELKEEWVRLQFAITEAAMKAASAPAPAPSPAPVSPAKPSAPGRSDFASVATASAPGQVVAAAEYLATLGIQVSDVVPDSSAVVLVSNDALYEGKALRPTISRNLLTQFGTGNQPASFVLRLSRPATSVSFTIPALHAETVSGITHPAWSATALDAAGRELAVHAEQLGQSYTGVAAQTHTLRAPGLVPIRAVRFVSDPRADGRPFAAFGAILIEQIAVAPAETP